MTHTTPSLRIAVGIATAGRASILPYLIEAIKKQNRQPDQIVICAPGQADIGTYDFNSNEITVLTGIRGLTAQRNAIVQASQKCEIIAFFDDDFIPSESYLTILEKVFNDNADVALVTGNVILDGVLIGGIEISNAWAAIRYFETHNKNLDHKLQDIYNAYGCNMCVRQKVMDDNGIYFDENLPLYGWLEDVDFSRKVSKYGRIVQSLRLIGVHLGVKTGRQPGVRLGYSQIANPIYIWGKGNMTLKRALIQILRNLSSNAIKFLWPESYIDRRGRFRGNIIGITDLIKGRLHPQSALRL